MTKPEDDEAVEVMLSVAAIGSYVINFSHLEHGIMRLIEWLGGNTTPGQISTPTLRFNWSQLIEKLRSDAVGSPVGAEVAALLDQYQVDLLARLRHSLVHGSVNVNRPPGIHIVRRMRDGSGPIMIGFESRSKQSASA